MPAPAWSAASTQAPSFTAAAAPAIVAAAPFQPEAATLQAPEEAFVVDAGQDGTDEEQEGTAPPDAAPPAPEFDLASFSVDDIEVIEVSADEDRAGVVADSPARPAVEHIDAAVDAVGAAGAVPAAPAAEQQLALPLDAEPGVDIRSDPVDTPSFVRKAEQAARWRSPRVRAALAAGCLLAAMGLAGQWMLTQRDLVAARSPGLKPALEAACAALGCEVRPPRSLEGLRVESSGVVRADKADHYRVSVALRNLRPHDVALPAFELALTDTQGQLIARRVLRASDLGARSAAVAAGAELPLQCTIQVASGTVAGYTIEIFYP